MKNVLIVGFLIIMFSAQAVAEPFIPRRQSKPPGPPLSPAEAIAKMTVPEGFKVELVAAEPDLVNPVAMTFDARGRVWVTESLEYPRFSAGPGRDRVKVLEDTNGDGKADKVTIFAEGLNIPSGIAVGHGGVWVANAPDILFLQDTDGDGKADKREVVVTGFGRTDTHELPNSLTWGPDGWLYGLNGVFNHSRVEHRGKTHEFTCALFRIHPRTREFELFAEGTSNPWGIAWDPEGSAFVSACVIDHLWHLTETGYYQRQGGPYPPFTWHIGSIVKHKHQMAAYCGLHYFDSDAYPQEFRDRLYMGNIHGGCINVDKLQRAGSTYFATGEPDFLTANDVWFMPVVQKTGPDGCLYVLDWYDRYHCYQDAQRDPEGIDRLNGRLYRVRYGDSPRAGKFDLSKESDDQLIARLASPNIYFRDLAQRLLAERADPATAAKLQRLVLDESAADKPRRHALWALIGGGPLDVVFHRQLLESKDDTLRAWAVRAAGDQRRVDPSLREKIVSLTADPAPQVQLQVAIAARKLEGVDASALLIDVLAGAGDDPLIPHIVWQNLHPLLDQPGGPLARIAANERLLDARPVAALLPRMIDRVLASEKPDTDAVAALFRLTIAHRDRRAAAEKCLAMLAERIQTRELGGAELASLRPKLEPSLQRILDGDVNDPLFFPAAVLAATWKHDAAMHNVRDILQSPFEPVDRRLQALEALVAAGDANVLDAVAPVLADRQHNVVELRGRIIQSLGRVDHPRVAQIVLETYGSMEPSLRPKVIELLTARAAWSKQLLGAIGNKQIAATALNANQVRKLMAIGDKELAAAVRKHWGTIRTERNPAREQVIDTVKKTIADVQGDPARGQLVFNRACGQCHKIYGEGHEVGPDITSNGRSSLEQLLSNVFDPSLVIGAGYQAHTVATSDGRVLAGLLVEDSPQRVVLKVQGGKLETIARDDVDGIKKNKVSLMPEGVENDLKPQELADLIEFLILDKPPGDPKAKRIPETTQ